MSYRKPKGPGSIHGWSTHAGRIDSDPPGQVFGARLVFWALLVCVLLALANGAHAAEPPKLEPFIGYTHVSDVLRGPPLAPAMPGCEPTTDWFGVGVTVVWRKAEIDIAHGVKARDFWCGPHYRQSAESGTLASVRWYPWRK